VRAPAGGLPVLARVAVERGPPRCAARPTAAQRSVDNDSAPSVVVLRLAVTLGREHVGARARSRRAQYFSPWRNVLRSTWSGGTTEALRDLLASSRLSRSEEQLRVFVVQSAISQPVRSPGSSCHRPSQRAWDCSPRGVTRAGKPSASRSWRHVLSGTIRHRL